MDASRKASLAKTFASAREAAMQRDTATFLGVTTPPEVNQFVALLGTKIEKPIFRKIVEFVFEYLKGTSASQWPTPSLAFRLDIAQFSSLLAEITEQHWDSLKQSTNLPPAILNTAFAGMHTLLKRAIRTRVPVESFLQDAVEVLKIPQAFANDLGAIIKNWYENL